MDTITKIIHDKMNMSDSFGKSLRGHVDIFIEEKTLGKRHVFSGKNLIVDYGRLVALQRVHNTNIDDNGDDYQKGKTQFISWCGVGSGGVVDGNVVSPQSSDTGLYTTEAIYADADPNVPVEYLVDHTKTPIWDFKQVVPQPIEEQISSKNVITIDFTDCADDTSINEAALYVSDSTVGGSTSGDNIHQVTKLVMFAHVCFPTILKTVSRKLVFEWYVYF